MQCSCPKTEHWAKIPSISSFKYHYIREQMDSGIIEVEFVRLEENLADLFTKSLGRKSFEYHSGKLLKIG